MGQTYAEYGEWASDVNTLIEQTLFGSELQKQTLSLKTMHYYDNRHSNACASLVTLLKALSNEGSRTGTEYEDLLQDFTDRWDIPA